MPTLRPHNLLHNVSALECALIPAARSLPQCCRSLTRTRSHMQDLKKDPHDTYIRKFPGSIVSPFRYGYRWVKPKDPLVMDALLDRLDCPVRQWPILILFCLYVNSMDWMVGFVWHIQCRILTIMHNDREHAAYPWPLRTQRRPFAQIAGQVLRQLCGTTTNNDSFWSPSVST